MKILKNKKFALSAAILLGVAAVSSSAVAAYVITGGSQSGEASVDPTEIEITNNVANLKVTETDVDLLFQPETPVSTGRVQSTGNGDLSVSLTLTFDSNTQDIIPELSVSIETSDGANDAVAKNYIVNPTVENLTSSDFTGSANNWSKELTLTWSWGTQFGNTDPCTYYNEGGAGYTKDLDTVNSELEAFKTAVAATSFVIKIAAVN